ncbi:hypothetical protein RJ639_044173 [Escallonia herrerae]|uniref:Uncharacterized protein n=1 Tax=Escallonia herrerae TaxID=1293975 RepID=A0AA88W8W0_9ASTE|nr:hypothetical protein RJ639_044173 [Escallonia herrerae]
MPPATRPAELEGTTYRVQPQSEEVQQPLPPPPRMSHLRAASYHFQSSSTASEGKLSSSMSMRVQQGGAMLSRQSSRRENFDRKREKKLKHEDSIWKKTIILGEKCRVPDEDDAVVCDEKGHIIPTYHRKIPSSFSVSRQTSGIDPDAIPS